MNAASAPALYAFQVYGTEAETTDALTTRESQLTNQNGEGEYDLVGRRYNLPAASHGIFVKGGRKVLR